MTIGFTLLPGPDPAADPPRSADDTPDGQPGGRARAPAESSRLPSRAAARESAGRGDRTGPAPDRPAGLAQAGARGSHTRVPGTDAAHRTRRRRIFTATALLLATLPLLEARPARAQPRVEVVGLFPDGAILVIDAAPPRTLRIRQVSPEGVRLVSSGSGEAVVEAGGRRQSLPLGQAIATQRPTTGRQQAVIQSDGQGHFWASGDINGASVRMLVDTGATLITLSSGNARRLGINYLGGTPVQSSTANGIVRGWRVTLARVRVGDITLHGIEAAVQEGDGLPVILLGMSFLNRVEMQRDGDRMTLLRRF